MLPFEYFLPLLLEDTSKEPWKKISMLVTMSNIFHPYSQEVNHHIIKNCEGAEIFIILQANRLAGYNFADAAEDTGLQDQTQRTLLLMAQQAA